MATNIDPVSISPTTTVGTPSIVLEHNYPDATATSGGVAVLSTAKSSSSAPIPAASTKTQVVI